MFFACSKTPELYQHCSSIFHHVNQVTHKPSIWNFFNILKMKKPNTKTTKVWEVKPSSNIEPLMNKESQIFTHYAPTTFCTYGSTCMTTMGDDPFRVVESGLYYEVVPSIYYFLVLFLWLSFYYQEEEKKNYIIHQSKNTRDFWHLIIGNGWTIIISVNK